MDYDFDPYVMLGVGVNASDEDIKRAFRKLAQRLHPDKNPMRSANEQFQVINNAYNLLTDTNLRRKYDDVAKKKKQEQSYFTLRVTPSRRAILPMPDPQVVYMLAEIMASPDALSNAEQEARLNITLVIDQSNSMQDERRMMKVKAAAQALIQQLSPKDTLSVVSFNDWANVIVPAQVAADKNSLSARISLIQPSGGTEILKGLTEGINQNHKFLSPKVVNHVILLTDGRTYGDEEACIALAQRAKDDGISISTMGLGNDWNDKFLDQLASVTGGSSVYVRTINSVANFLDEQVRSLSNAFAERVQFSIATDNDIQLEMAFKLAPSPQSLPHDNGVITLASLQAKRPIAVLFQLQLPPAMPVGYRSIVRLVASGNILQNQASNFQAVSDLSAEVTPRPLEDDRPPAVIVEALSKLTLYRLQEKAQDAMDRGDFNEATKRLETLATRLYDIGEEGLGKQARLEAQHIKQTRQFSSDKSKLTLKYQTRSLVGTAGLEQAITSMFLKNMEDKQG